MDGLLLKIWKLNKVSKCKVIRYGKSVASSGKNKFHLEFTFQRLHRGVFCQFPFRRIYYYGSNNSTGKEISKTHLCGLCVCVCVCVKQRDTILRHGGLHTDLNQCNWGS